MTTDDLDFQESLDRYFEIEAAELLQTIEQTLLSLVEEKTIERVHTLMRAAHTIKGSAANCGFKTIETIAHHLEDVFQALYPPELEIDPELGLLLMEGYDCLYDPLSALLAKVPYDEAATLERTATLFARLQTHLGDFFGRETPLPTAAELGFDVIGSIFTDSIPHDLEDLATAIASQQEHKVSESLRSLAEFLLELGGSYSLPGIAAIAKTTLSALECHPARVLQLAPIVLANFQQAQIEIAGGDRSIGGEVSAELAAWGGSKPPATSTLSPSIEVDATADWLSLVEPTSFTNLGGEEAEVTTNNSDSLEWLSLVDDESTIDEPQAIDLKTSSEWLSLVDDETIVEPLTASMDADSTTTEWLSLVDDETTSETPAAIANPDLSATEWLAFAEDETISDLPVETDLRDNSTEWLSLVEDETTEPTTVDLEPEIVEIGSFEPEPTEYLVEAIESHSSNELTIATKSGVDRIFQSIAFSNLAPTSADPDATSPTPEREAPADLSVSVRVATVQLERLSHTIGELLIDDNQQDLRAQQLQKLTQATVEQYRRCEQKLRLVSDWADKNAAIDDRQKVASRRGKTAKNRRKSAKKTADRQIQSQFDSLELDVYSDLSILIQNLTDDLAELGTQVGNLAEMTQRSRLTMHKRQQLLGEAQSELFEARMVEIAGVLNRFPRLLQQMVASHRKPARLELIGSEVSIDKIIAEKL